jgi:hypothetical protein
MGIIRILMKKRAKALFFCSKFLIEEKFVLFYTVKGIREVIIR